MSFYTSLSGLNAATTQLGVTSNNIANTSTVGFKRSTTDFGDVFATSPLQNADTTIGQGVTLKQVKQDFGQGDMIPSSNTLDLAISGSGFFPLKSQDGLQNIYTRNGAFMMNDQNNVVNSSGQKLLAASVDSAGNANLSDMNVLTIPQKTSGQAKQTTQIQLGINLPSDAAVITKAFNQTDPTTYNKSTSVTVYDQGGNAYLATVYYVKTQNASSASPNNRWQTYVYVGNQLVSSALQQATDSTGSLQYVNKYGQIKSASQFTSPQDIAALNSSFSQKTEKFTLDNLTNTQTSQPATVVASATTGLGTGASDGINFGNYLNMSKSDLLIQQGSSAATYSLDPAVVGPASVEFGPAAARVTVNVPVTNGKSPTPVEVANALNANASFVGTYVAEATNTSATVNNINFDLSATNPFSSFSVTVGGQAFNLSNLNSTDTDLNAMAADINAQLGALDGGITPQRITVTTDSATNPTQLIIKDSAQRDISDIKLTKATKATGMTGQVSAGSAPVYGGQVLKITALDTSVNAEDILGTTTTPGVIISQNGTALQNDPTATTPATGFSFAQQTPYPRANVAYTVNAASTAYTATFGTSTSPVDVVATSATDLVTALNKNVAFASSFVANFNTATNQIQVQVKDPTNPLASSITSVLKIFQNNGDSTVPMTPINDPTVLTMTQGKPALLDSSKHSIDDLENLFTINVDNSQTPVTVGLDMLWNSMSKLPATANKVLSGAQIAAEITNEINRSYGDEKPFNFSAMSSPTFSVQLNRPDGTTLAPLPIDLSGAGNMRREDLVAAVQAQIDASTLYGGSMKVSYDTLNQQLVFTPSDTSKVTVSSANSGLNLTTALTQGVNDGSLGVPMTPSVSAQPYRAMSDQRYGVAVTYDSVNQEFVYQSGTTGDASSIAITNIRPGSLATQTAKGLGMTGDAASFSQATSPISAQRGITSTPAVLTGNALAVNVNNNFSVDATNNQFVVSVDGITGTVTIPPKDNYTIDTFTAALQSGINSLMGPSVNGMTPQSVSGVTVKYDPVENAMVFTTGTASSSSYIKVSGDTKFGLNNLSAAFGATSTWIKPTPSQDPNGATVYIDNFGKETTSATGYNNLPEWSPIYLEKGELTFNTTGNLVSPKQGAKLDTVYLPNGKGALSLNIDYSKSTQYATPFAVLTQSQDGAPEGDLVGLSIKDDGLVQASYSNGSTQSLGKVVLVNFSNPTGLRQLGNTDYYATSASGTPKLGSAGSAGFGTLKSSNTEHANVDLTQELVDLITEQRNFQANSKALETSTSLTQTIIQIRA